ncbi:uncharacterized protein J4E79_009406 [Alternaria viburni]|uniref:uncharacterized protein n=1 Tax=Alternaria viburni TaxID=566460 RepID=UPI0020C3C73A|nr:uncharacterized protein J4E79_009406 [Alternaria viburni]KAI4650139.1 hypothetical protein J4E79_009406 [Alternaria viburni]
MKNSYESTDPKDIRSFEQSIFGFKFLESQMGDLVGLEIFNMKSLLVQIRTQLDWVVATQSDAQVRRVNAEIAFEQVKYISQAVPDVASRCEALAERARAECDILKKRVDSSFDRLRDAFADQVLRAMEVIWRVMSTKAEDATKQLGEAKKELQGVRSASSAANEIGRNSIHDLQLKLAVIQRDFAKKKVALEDEYGELKKKHYTDLQKLVEERMRSEKIKLSDRLSKAEAKAMQYAKVLQEKEALEARVLEEGREKALFKQAKLEWEQKYKERDDEAKALRQGYDQFSNDNQALQTEKAVLQADFDELKKEHKPLPGEHTPSYELRHVDQHTMALPHVSSTTAFDRQAAELQHLDGLVAIWQTTLENATAEMNESTVRKEALEAKIREAEEQLEKLKPAPSQKTSHKSKMKSKPKGASKKEQAIVNEKADDETVLQPSVNTSGGLLKVRVATEAFPALSSPAVPKTIPSTTWKSLRLVDIPKEDTKDARKKSG